MNFEKSKKFNNFSIVDQNLSKSYACTSNYNKKKIDSEVGNNIDNRKKYMHNKEKNNKNQNMEYTRNNQNMGYSRNNQNMGYIRNFRK